MRSTAEKILALLHRIRHFQDFEKQKKWLDGIIDQYHGTAEFYGNHKFVIVNVFFITLLQRCLLFLVTWFTYRAFHLAGQSLLTIVLLQAMIAVAADMLPLPGGMGVSENLFLAIFDRIFGESLVRAGVLLSRGISYYTQLLISAVMTAVASLVINDKRKTGETV